MRGSAPRVLVLDHRDSFVFILVDHFAQLGATVRTLRTGVSLEQLRTELSAFDPDLVLLSPGPGHPEQAGVMVPFLRTQPSVPVLGVCLGHQALAVAAGGTSIGTKGMLLAAKTLAATATELFQNPETIALATSELHERRGVDFVYKALVGDREPPLDYRR